MSVKTASKLVTRVMRGALREALSPANQPLKASSASRSLNEAGNVSRKFGNDLQQHTHAYTGSVDPFCNPSNTADRWRLQFCQPERELDAANASDVQRIGRGER